MIYLNLMKYLYEMPIKIALILSVILQFATATIAISLIKRTKTNIAWWLISLGFLLMAIRRLFELFQVYGTENNIVNSLANSWIGVFISILMLISLSFIKRIFNIQKRFQELKRKNEARVFSAIIRTEENQKQRLCLARGLAVKPRIILADEPTSSLDPVSSKIIETLFRELKKHYTIILVTHILRQAQRMADNVIFMNYGEIIEQGNPNDIFYHPKTSQMKEYMVEGN